MGTCGVCYGSGQCRMCAATGTVQGQRCPTCHGSRRCAACGGAGRTGGKPYER